MEQIIGEFLERLQLNSRTNYSKNLKEFPVIDQKLLGEFFSGISHGISNSNSSGDCVQCFLWGFHPEIYLKKTSEEFLQKFFRAFLREFFQGFPPESPLVISLQVFLRRFSPLTPSGLSPGVLKGIANSNSFGDFLSRFYPDILPGIHSRSISKDFINEYL